jgi:hypothetical protein
MIELSKRIIELIENARKYVVKNTNTTMIFTSIYKTVIPEKEVFIKLLQQYNQ